MTQSIQSAGLGNPLAKVLSNAGKMLLAVCFCFLCCAPAKAVSPTTFKITSLEVKGSNVIVRWQGGGTTNQLQRKTTLTGSWANVGLPTTASSATNPIVGPTAFFRVLTVNNSGGGDNVAPTVVILSPILGSVLSGTIPLTSLATDNLGGSGVARVEFYRDNGVLLDATTTAPFTGSFDTTLLTNGSYNLYAKVYDVAGNSSTSAGIAVTLNNLLRPPNAWSKRFGGTSSDGGQAMAIDGSGNIVLAGYFTGTADFGGGNLTSAGGNDIVIAKYSASGTHLWSRRYGAAADEQVNAVALDAAGNIYVAGTFYNGSTMLGGATLTNAGQYDCFLAKYDASGNHLWSKAFGGPGRDLFTSLVIDSAGNLIVSGTFQSAYPGISFGGDPIYTQGPAKIVLAKYRPDGTHLWSKVFASGAANTSYALLATGTNLILAGSFNYSIDFGLGTMFSPSTQFEAMFLTKLDGNGNAIWQRQYGSDKVSKITALALDAAGNIVAGGFFYTKTDLGAGTLTGVGNDDNISLAKYSGTDGSYLWGKVMDGNNGAYVSGVGCDAQNNVFITGYYYGNVNFGGTTLSSLALGYDVFAAKYTSSGALAWANSYGGTGADLAKSMAMDSTGHPTITGNFSDAAILGGSTLVSVGSFDTFLMRLNP